jgi:hypothetical protein
MRVLHPLGRTSLFSSGGNWRAHSRFFAACGTEKKGVTGEFERERQINLAIVILRAAPSRTRAKMGARWEKGGQTWQ